VSERELSGAIDAAVRVVDIALQSEMHTMTGEPALSALERLRAELVAMRERGAVDADELRTIIRGVATWAPEDDVTLLGSLGAIARARG
jgi:hypothetical protein